MSATLLDRLSETTGQNQRSAAEQYRRLLARADNPEPGDEVLLADVLADLNLTPKDVEAHLALLAKAKDLAGRIVDPKQTDAQYTAAGEAEAAYVATAREICKEIIDGIDVQRIYNFVWPTLCRVGGPDQTDRMEAAMKAAVYARMNASNATTGNREVAHELAALRRDNPLVFGSAPTT